MNEKKRRRPVIWILVAIMIGGILPILILVMTAQSVVAQEGVTYDNLCLEDAFGGNVNCTANDFGITDIEFIEVIDPCTYIGDTATVRMLLTADVGSPERFDIGYFLALSGTNAIDSGNTCYHSYLQPVSMDNNVTYSPTSGIGPFWQGSEAEVDICGDSEGNDVPIEFITPQIITIACLDSPDDPDNLVDINVCASYKQANDSFCPNVTGAIPGTASKCGCTLFNMPFDPTGITLADVTAESGGTPWLPLLAALLLLVAATVLVIRLAAKKPVEESS
jgi:hypothetical protein